MAASVGFLATKSFTDIAFPFLFYSKLVLTLKVDMILHSEPENQVKNPILEKNNIKALSFDLKCLQRVRYWTMNLITCQILNPISCPASAVEVSFCTTRKQYLNFFKSDFGEIFTSKRSRFDLIHSVNTTESSVWYFFKKHELEEKFSQKVNFWIDFFTTYQISKWRFYNVAGFESTSFAACQVFIHLYKQDTFG